MRDSSTEIKNLSHLNVSSRLASTNQVRVISTINTGAPMLMVKYDIPIIFNHRTKKILYILSVHHSQDRFGFNRAIILCPNMSRQGSIAHAYSDRYCSIYSIYSESFHRTYFESELPPHWIPSNPVHNVMQPLSARHDP